MTSKGEQWLPHALECPDCPGLQINLHFQDPTQEQQTTQGSGPQGRKKVLGKVHYIDNPSPKSPAWEKIMFLLTHN